MLALLSALKRMWNWLIAPPSDVTDPVEQHRCQLLARVMLFMIALGTVAATIELLTQPNFKSEFTSLLAITLSLSVVYFLTRRHFRLFSALTVSLVPTFGSIGAFLHGDLLAITFMLLSVMLAGAFLTVWQTAIFTVVNIVLATILLLSASREVMHISYSTLLAFVVIFSLLRLVLMRYRNSLVIMQQQQLRASERDLRSLAENAMEGILISVKGEHVFANRYIEKLLGYAPGELIGSTMQDVLPDEEYERVSLRHQRRLAGEEVPTQFESLLKTKTGEIIPIEVNAAITEWHGEKGGMMMIRDIRRRRQRQLELDQQRALLQSVISNSSTMIWMLDKDGIFTLSDGQGLREIGLIPGQLVGQSIFNVYANHPGMINDARRALQGELVQSQQKVDGRSFQISYIPLFNHAQQIQGTVGVATDISQLLDGQQQVRRSQQELESILRNMQDTLYRLDNTGRFVHVSGASVRLIGYTSAELLGRDVAEFYFDPQGRERFLEVLSKNYGEVENHEILLRHKDGSPVWVSINAHYYFNEEGKVAGIEGTTRNVTRQHQAEELTRTLSSALEQTADLVMIANRQGRITYVNSGFVKATGYTAAEAIGQNTNLLVSGKQSAQFYKNLWTTILLGNAFSDVFINRRKNGELYYEEKTITPLRDADGMITHFVSTGKDITERMQTQERLRFMAHHDALTELPNRTLFLDRLKQAMARARWHTRKVAVMFMDLDRFKTINDTLGHNVGDQLLIKLTQRLAANVRAGDTVARFGGDEFAIMLDDIASEQDVSYIAKKILTALAPAIEINQRELFISASIGISIFPVDGEDPEVVLRNADVAMYRAKELGRNNYQFYSSEMSARAFERLALENALRYALQRNEFFLLYQPQIDARNGRLTGVEALLRWRHPDMGVVMPSDFVTLLEETGMIVDVGEWVLREACLQAVQWHRDGIKLRVSVNLSGRQFNDPNFLQCVESILEETGIKPNYLELELTESMLMRNNSQTIHALEVLGKRGVLFAIDDFGTGYSSLSYLRRFPINTLKVDHSFIRDVTLDSDDAAIATAIIVMAQSLGLDVIAEGVENIEQLTFLQTLDCHTMQGFYFSAAVPPHKISEMVTQGVVPLLA